MPTSGYLDRGNLPDHPTEYVDPRDATVCWCCLEQVAMESVHGRPPAALPCGLNFLEELRLDVSARPTETLSVTKQPNRDSLASADGLPCTCPP
jgi:hypothetical protein